MVAGQVGVSAALPAPPPMLEVVRTDEPLAVSVSVEAEPAAEFQEIEADEPQAIASEPEPPRSGLTPLQRDLLDRARAPKGVDGVAKRTAPIKPFQSDPDDYDERRTGDGGPPPGAIKVI
jgi:hypothetical protein